MMDFDGCVALQLVEDCFLIGFFLHMELAVACVPWVCCSGWCWSRVPTLPKPDAPTRARAPQSLKFSVDRSRFHAASRGRSQLFHAVGFARVRRSTIFHGLHALPLLPISYVVWQSCTANESGAAFQRYCDLKGLSDQCVVS